MKNLIRHAGSLVLLTCALACTGIRNGPQPIPVPGSADTRTEAISRIAPPGGWSFHYRDGASNYRTKRIAGIEALSDSGLHREISTNTTYELVNIESSSGSDTMLVTVLADSFATTTQGRIGPVQSVQLPVRISATFTGTGIMLAGQSGGEKCNPVGSTLASDLRNLLPIIPAQLTPGMSWSDSIQTGGCQAGIPTILNLHRVFVVSGETRGQSQPLLVILRTDSIAAHGEGAQLQHRVALQAEGTGRATYYFDPVIGKVVQLTTGQDLSLSFSTSSRTTRFHEKSQQEFVLLR